MHPVDFMLPALRANGQRSVPFNEAQCDAKPEDWVTYYQMKHAEDGKTTN